LVPESTQSERCPIKLQIINGCLFCDRSAHRENFSVGSGRDAECLYLIQINFKPGIPLTDIQNVNKQPINDGQIENF
jgi:hypothetical protein